MIGCSRDSFAELGEVVCKMGSMGERWGWQVGGCEGGSAQHPFVSSCPAPHPLLHGHRFVGLLCGGLPCARVARHHVEGRCQRRGLQLGRGVRTYAETKGAVGSLRELRCVGVDGVTG